MTPFTLRALALAAIAAPAFATPLDVTEISQLSVPDLRVRYLECDRLASGVVLDFGTAAHCSVVYEALLQRGFDGRFDELLAWWQKARRERAGSAPAPDTQSVSR